MYREVSELIKKKKKYILTSHVNPDGDSIGSVIAMYTYLKKKEKDVRIINCSPTPDNYLFLDTDKVIEEYDESKHDSELNSTDVIIVLDTNEYSRLKYMGDIIKKSKSIKVCIDHHLGIRKEDFDFVISDIDSPATGEILYRLIKDDGVNIDKSIAVPLYTAIMTDTGSFRYPRTDSETHKITADLIESGADPVEIHNEVYDKVTVGIIHLLTRFLNKITFMYENKLVFATLRKTDFAETSTTIMDTDGFSKHMMSINTVRLSMIFTESDRGVKISFRSKGDLPVNELAKQFGGGGHLNAAGTFVENAIIDELVTEVLNKSKKYIN